MGRTARKFSDDEIGTINGLRANNTPWSVIGEHLGCDWETIRRAVDPDYVRLRREQIRTARRVYRAPKNTCHVVRVEVPDEVWQFQIARYEALQRASVTQILQGDPPPGFSALDRKSDANVAEFARVVAPLFRGARL